MWVDADLKSLVRPSNSPRPAALGDGRWVAVLRESLSRDMLTLPRPPSVRPRRTFHEYAASPRPTNTRLCHVFTSNLTKGQIHGLKSEGTAYQAVRHQNPYAA